jgi:hypothetical protein
MRLPPTTTVGPFVKFRIVGVGRWYFRAVASRLDDGPESNAGMASAPRGRLTELPPVRADVALSERAGCVGWVADRVNRLLSRSVATDPPRATPMGAAGRCGLVGARILATGGSSPPVLAGSWTSLVEAFGRGVVVMGRSEDPPRRVLPDRLAAFTFPHHRRRRAGGWWQRRRGSIVVVVSRTWVSPSHVAQR